MSFQLAPGLISNLWLYLISILLACIWYCLKNKYLLLSLAFILGFTYVQFYATAALQARNHKITAYKTIRATGNIADIPNCINGRCKFKFLIKDIQPSSNNGWYYGLTATTWINAPKNLNVGQEWELSLKLKSPHMAANPGSFDLERFYFTQKIHTISTVLHKSTKNVLINDNIFSYSIDRLRQYLANKTKYNLSSKEFSSFILALTLGIKQNISSAHNKVLQNTGTAHLMAISGLHIGFVALLALYSVNFITNIFINSIDIARDKIAASGAIILASIYSALSGLQIPSLRAIIMLNICLTSKIFSRTITGWQSFYASLGLILLVDPLAVYTAGFWLSFIAVFMLLYTAPSNLNKSNWLFSMLKIQLILLVGLLPLSICYFSKFSLISPLANLIAVPIVSFWVIPLAIVGTILQLIINPIGKILLQLAHLGFSIVWGILEYLSSFESMQINFFHMSTTSLLLAAIGSLWIVAPKGFSHKFLGILCFLPVLFPGKTSIKEGEFKFTLLDVGQGLATVVQTKNHVLLYDTGLKYSEEMDSGQSVILPFLSYLKIRNIDLILISHPDLDHFGGTKTLVQNTKGIKISKIAINDISALVDPDFKNIDKYNCKAGQNWQWDGVDFKILYPLINPKGGKNEYSCVLKITNAAGSILLPGDIGEKTEQQLVNLYGDTLKAEVLIVAHHGSKNSSSMSFLQAVEPKLSLISAGYLNVYKHPAPETIARLKAIKSKVISTEHCGATSILFTKHLSLQPECYRVTKKGI